MKSNDSSSGVGVFTVTQIVFLILKLAGLVTWSWFWVLSPLWIEVTLWLFIRTIVATAVAFNERK